MQVEQSELRPQRGPQEKFLKSVADLCFYGGSAGSGKTFALLLEMLFDIALAGFRAVIFRRTIPMVRQPGGLLDVSGQVYSLLGAKLNQSVLEWNFPSGATVKLAGMELEQDRYAWQGSQISLIAFDEVQEFTENQFWFLVSRNRSTSGARSRVRCTCNPDGDSWLRSFLSWWIDPESGFAIKERSGVLRWFVRDGDSLIWGDSQDELKGKFGADCAPKSVTFIPAHIGDNRILLEKDPAYLSNLKALPLVERARLLDGNWNVRATAGSYFRREWFGVVDAAPADVVARCRYWDRAACEKRPGKNDPDATVGVLLSKDRQGIYFVEDVRKLYASPHKVEEAMRACAEQDGKRTMVAFMQDPGSAGVAEAQATARALDGFDVRFATATGDKETRAKPISAQAEAGNVKLVRGLWSDEFLRMLENFPAGKHDDEVDGLSGAHSVLLNASNGAITSEQVAGLVAANSHGHNPVRVWQPRMWNVRQNDFSALERIEARSSTETTTHPKQMRTRDDILNDQALNPFQRAALLDQLAPQGHADPAVRPPMTPETRAMLEQLAAEITRQADKISALEQREQAVRARLEPCEQLVRSLQVTADTEIDASVDALVREEKRLGLMKNFIQNAPALHARLMEELTRTMRQLDEVLRTVEARAEFPPAFYNLQNCPLPRCNEAIAYIKMKLKS